MRDRVGRTGRSAWFDEQLSGAANLLLLARLLGYSPPRPCSAPTSCSPASGSPPRPGGALRDVLTRHAPPPRPRREHRRPARPGAPRRADDGPGPALPRRGGGGPARPGPRRDDGAGGHPGPRRGGPARRPPLGPRGRPRRRRGDAGASSGPGPRRLSDGPAGAGPSRSERTDCRSRAREVHAEPPLGAAVPGDRHARSPPRRPAAAAHREHDARRRLGQHGRAHRGGPSPGTRRRPAAAR